MANITVPDAKIAIVEAFLAKWKVKSLENIDKILANPDLPDEQRTQLLEIRAATESKGWKAIVWETFTASAKQTVKQWAKEDAEPKAKALINKEEADALAELDGL